MARQQRVSGFGEGDEAFFPYSSEHMGWGARTGYNEISKRIKGRIASSRFTCGVIAELAYNDGVHLEIGTMFGGTALIAASIKKAYKCGKVVVIDPLSMFGYYGTSDPITGILPTAELFWENAKACGLEEYIELYDQPSHPFPAHLGDFATAFIDGDHTIPHTWYDWEAVSERTHQFVAFDNVDRAHPDVVTVFKAAQLDPYWELAALFDIVGVLRRRRIPN